MEPRAGVFMREIISVEGAGLGAKVPSSSRRWIKDNEEIEFEEDQARGIYNYLEEEER